MQRRHPPRLWLMTDERMGDALWSALRRLPRGSGVVFRHYRTPPAERRRLFAAIRRIARARRLVLIRAGAMPLRGEDGAHNRPGRHRGLTTHAVHDRRDLVAAARSGANVVFVSPVFATRSHRNGRALGATRAAQLARAADVPAIALGGMNARRFAQLRQAGFHGWAAIDAWLEDGPVA